MKKDAAETFTHVALALGGLWLFSRMVAKRAPKNLPADAKLVLCNDYRGRRLCVYEMSPRLGVSPYRGTIDDGTLIEYEGPTPEITFQRLKEMVDASS